MKVIHDLTEQWILFDKSHCHILTNFTNVTSRIIKAYLQIKNHWDMTQLAVLAQQILTSANVCLVIKPSSHFKVHIFKSQLQIQS